MNRYSVVFITQESKDAPMYESSYKIFFSERIRSLLAELHATLPDNVISLKIHLVR